MQIRKKNRWKHGSTYIAQIQVSRQVICHAINFAHALAIVQDSVTNLVVSYCAGKGSSSLKEMLDRDRRVSLRLVHDRSFVRNFVNWNNGMDPLPVDS